MKEYSLAEIAKFLDAKLVGDPEYSICSIKPLNKAAKQDITFLEKSKYRDYLATTEAGAVILRDEDVSHVKTNALVVNDPYLAYAKLTALFDNTPKIQNGIHPTAIFGKNCDIDESVSIGAYAVIGNNVKIGKDAIIGATCVIGDNVIIGNTTCLNPRVTLYHGVKIGERSLIHSGAVIGADGFGMANNKGEWKKIYQLGAVAIGNDVEIGANTTIDRGALSDTIIHNGAKLDNQIQVGHNVEIGEHTAIAGCTGIAGSAIIGKHCMIGGGVGINGHIKIVDGVIVTAMSGVDKSILVRGIYSSSLSATPHLTWWRTLARLMQLDKLTKRVKILEEKLKIIN